jgi:hypothetical protein
MMAERVLRCRTPGINSSGDGGAQRPQVVTGAGIALGGSVGLIFGLMLSDTWWGLLLGTAGGLVVGAIVDAQRSAGRGPGRRRQ